MVLLFRLFSPSLNASTTRSLLGLQISFAGKILWMPVAQFERKIIELQFLEQIKNCFCTHFLPQICFDLHRLTFGFSRERFQYFEILFLSQQIHVIDTIPSGHSRLNDYKPLVINDGLQFFWMKDPTSILFY